MSRCRSRRRSRRSSPVGLPRARLWICCSRGHARTNNERQSRLVHAMFTRAALRPGIVLDGRFEMLKNLLVLAIVATAMALVSTTGAEAHWHHMHHWRHWHYHWHHVHHWRHWHHHWHHWHY